MESSLFRGFRLLTSPRCAFVACQVALHQEHDADMARINSSHLRLPLLAVGRSSRSNLACFATASLSHFLQLGRYFLFYCVF